MNDVDTLIGRFDRLVDAGSSVIVLEHNLDVISRADWVIDLGPGAGQAGGRHGAVWGRADRSRDEREYADRTILVPSPGHSLTPQGIRFGYSKAGATKEGNPVTKGSSLIQPTPT